MGLSVLVEWIREERCSIEDINSVPETCRSVGNIAPVKWNNKGRYPAKILKISDNMEDLLNEEAEQLKAKEQAKKQLPEKRSRASRKRPSSAVASTSEVALAIDGKVKVPAEHEKASTKVMRKKKADVAAAKSAQSARDAALLAMAGNRNKNKDPSPPKNVGLTLQVYTGESDEEDNPDMSTKEDSLGKASTEDAEGETTAINIFNCTCKVSVLLQSFGNRPVKGFLEALAKFYQTSGDSTKASAKSCYLPLLKIPGNVNKAELTKSKGVYISAAVKNQIKLDHPNKPFLMARDLVFALYGHDMLQASNITARGKMAGTLGIHPNVVKAILSFINRNVDETKRITEAQLGYCINRRLPSWRTQSEEKPTRRNAPASVTESELLDLESDYDEDVDEGEEEYEQEKTSGKLGQKSPTGLEVVNVHSDLPPLAMGQPYKFTVSPFKTARIVTPSKAARSPAQLISLSSPNNKRTVSSPAKSNLLADGKFSQPFGEVKPPPLPSHPSYLSYPPNYYQQPYYYPYHQYQCPQHTPGYSATATSAGAPAQAYGPPPSGPPLPSGPPPPYSPLDYQQQKPE